jgi:hypothetical protein
MIREESEIFYFTSDGKKWQSKVRALTHERKIMFAALLHAYGIKDREAVKLGNLMVSIEDDIGYALNDESVPILETAAGKRSLVVICNTKEVMRMEGEDDREV